jgi:hypothetical protein
MNNKQLNKPYLLSAFVFSGIAAGSYATWKYLTHISSLENVIDEDVVTPKCKFYENSEMNMCTFDKYIDDLVIQEISRAYDYTHQADNPKPFWKRFEYMDQLQLLLNRNNQPQTHHDVLIVKKSNQNI